MTDAPADAPVIGHILVSLDAASESRPAIETAARLAADAGASLDGLFIEDEELLHLADLPFTRHITLGTGTEPLSRHQVERHLRSAADRAGRELAAAAERHRVGYTFRVVRGSSADLLAGAAGHGLVVAGGLGRPIGRHFRLECRWWSSLDAAQGAFLLVRHGRRTQGTVAVLLPDQGPASARLLRAAAQIAAGGNRALTVLCPPSLAAESGLQVWIAEQLGGAAAAPRVAVAPVEPDELPARMAQLNCHLLAVGGLDAWGGRQLRQFFDRFACDILTVR